jgi:hypothetical protein
MTPTVNGKLALKNSFSLLNERSVENGTESSPIFLPLTYNANQLSTQISATKL